MSEYFITIKESHLDTFGHVNNATYLTLFEEARWELITQKGFGLKEVQSSGVGPVILEVQLKFIKELILREKIKITTELLGYEKKIGKLKQQMIKENGDVACEAVFTFALFDTRQRKIILPTEQWMKAISP
jgi:YbgC/YbaW family acyl-CoA thioester hydrolase